MDLGGLVFFVLVAYFAVVGEEEEASQSVEGFSSVELAADTPSERFVGEPAQGVVGALQFSVFDEGFGERVLAGSGLESGDEESGGYVAACDGAADA